MRTAYPLFSAHHTDGRKTGKSPLGRSRRSWDSWKPGVQCVPSELIGIAFTSTGRGPGPVHSAAGTINVAVPKEGPPVAEVDRNFNNVARAMGVAMRRAAVAVM